MSAEIGIGGSACAACGSAEPCSCVSCPTCGALAPYRELGHVCPSCDWREDRCACGRLMTFDPSYRGTSCGGLALVGARVCAPCGIAQVCRRSKPADAVDWQLAKGGRSLTAGGIKIRAEAGHHEAGTIEALMARIVRVPELELEVERLRDLLRQRAR